MSQKYKLREDLTKEHNGTTLYRVEALKDFGKVKKGDIGGYVESEKNLHIEGDSWIYDNALVYGSAEVRDNVKVSGCAKVSGHAKVYGNARVRGHAEVYGGAVITKEQDYYVGKNIWSSGRYFTYTRSNRTWKVGCFYGTGEELIEKAYKDSEVSGREYKRVVEYVEAMYNDLEKDKK